MYGARSFGLRLRPAATDRTLDPFGVVDEQGYPLCLVGAKGFALRLRPAVLAARANRLRRTLPRLPRSLFRFRYSRAITDSEVRIPSRI